MTSHASMIRALSDFSSEEGNDIAGDSGQSPTRGKLEFSAFVMWYISMILCCIVPTCCAYRRRRRLMRQMSSRRRFMEDFLRQQQEAAAEEGIEATAMLGSSRGSNLFVWSGSSGALYYGGNQVLALESLEGEVACWERRKRLEVAMKNATFIVEEGDIINLENSDNKENDLTNTNDESSQTDEKDIELGTALDIDETNTELRLPVGRLDSSTAMDDPNQQDLKNHDDVNIRDETVPGVCAICLCSYEVGDRVTYSQGVSATLTEQDVESGSSSRCPHAFHTDCIVQWLSKKNDAHPECPCCRRPFCSVDPLTTADLLTLNPNRARDSVPGRISSPTLTIPLYARHQIPMLALPVNSDNSNNNESEQRMVVLLPRSAS